MYLAHLNLTNFRNFRHLELEVPQGVVVVYGGNAQGKTNLLESVYLLAIAKSFRADNEREVVHWEAALEEGQALVAGLVQRQDSRLQIRIGFQCLPQGEAGRKAWEGGEPPFLVRKQIRVNGVPRTASELVGLANAVLFTAGDIELIHGPPTLRRRYLDILISQVDPLYLKALQRYQRILHQRNQLLKMLREGRAGEGELTFWDQELVNEGALIMGRRATAVDALSPLAWERHGELTAGMEDFRLQYVPAVPGIEGHEQLGRGLARGLEATRDRERALGATLVGPHRDDLKLLVGGVDMGLYASRGQARTLALALRLAEAAYLASLKGEEPLLLLDDVLSELDAARRRQVLDKALAYQQTLITTTGLEPFDSSFLSQAALFQVRDGSIFRAGEAG